MDVSVCPFCGTELEYGTLHNRGSNYFLPAGQKQPSFYSVRCLEKHNAVPLPPNPLEVKPTFPSCCICRLCKIIILPYTT